MTGPEGDPLAEMEEYPLGLLLALAFGLALMAAPQAWPLWPGLAGAYLLALGRAVL